MNKKTRLFVRISTTEKNAIKRAARNSKSMASFLLSTWRRARKYRRLIEQAEQLGLPTKAMKVIES